MEAVRGQENKTKMAGFNLGFNNNNNNNTNCARSSTGNGHQTLDLHHLHYLQVQPNSALSPSPSPGSTTAKSLKSKPIRYRECLKNHAASVGGSIYDGCGEFMPSGEEGSIEALKCAACDCHRNFHRKEVDGERSTAIVVSPLPIQHHPPPPPEHPPHHHHYSSPSSAIVAPVNVAFGGIGGGGGGGWSGGGTESSSEDLNLYHAEVGHGGMVPPPPPQFVLSKKRFRTKFSQEQKEKMMEFAEKIGWRMQKQDNEQVQRFCNELGVKRQVFKVWMHNNKNIIVKKTQLEPGLDHQQQQQQEEPLPL